MPSARDIAFIGCRLLALYVLYGILLTGAHSVFFLLRALGAAEENNASLLDYAGANVMSLGANLAVFFLLWFGAGWIAGKVATGTSEPSEEVPVGWSRQKALSLAIVALGLWVLIHHLPVLISYAPLMFIEDTDPAAARFHIQPASIISAVLTTILGVLCVLGPRGIAEGIAKLRRW